MTERQRRQAAIGASLFVILACTLTWILGRSHHASPADGVEAPARTHATVLRSVATGAQTVRTTPSDRSGGTTLSVGSKEHVLLLARQFAAAFARYEVGQVTPTVLRQLAATASPTLMLQLTSAPPKAARGAANPPPAEVITASLVRATAPTSVLTVRVQIRRGVFRGSLTLTIGRIAGLWRITSLG